MRDYSRVLCFRSLAERELLPQIIMGEIARLGGLSMTDRVGQITRDTLLPIGLVIGLVCLAYWFGFEKSGIHFQVGQNTKDISKHDAALGRLTDGVKRLEIHFGTLPENQQKQ